MNERSAIFFSICPSFLSHHLAHCLRIVCNAQEVLHIVYNAQIVQNEHDHLAHCLRIVYNAQQKGAAHCIQCATALRIVYNAHKPLRIVHNAQDFLRIVYNAQGFVRIVYNAQSCCTLNA